MRHVARPTVLQPIFVNGKLVASVCKPTFRQRLSWKLSAVTFFRAIWMKGNLPRCEICFIFVEPGVRVRYGWVVLCWPTPHFTICSVCGSFYSLAPVELVLAGDNIVKDILILLNQISNFDLVTEGIYPAFNYSLALPQVQAVVAPLNISEDAYTTIGLIFNGFSGVSIAYCTVAVFQRWFDFAGPISKRLARAAYVLHDNAFFSKQNTRRYIYIYPEVYIWLICVCVCVCMCKTLNGGAADYT